VPAPQLTLQRQTKMTETNLARDFAASSKVIADKIIDINAMSETLIFYFAVVGAFVVGAVISQLFL
jgi:hypothetical protein